MNILPNILIKQMIVGFFGFYTILIFCRLFRYKKGEQWLKEEQDEENGFAKGIIIGIIGLVSVSICFVVLALVLSLLGII